MCPSLGRERPALLECCSQAPGPLRVARGAALQQLRERAAREAEGAAQVRRGSAERAVDRQRTPLPTHADILVVCRHTYVAAHLRDQKLVTVHLDFARPFPQNCTDLVFSPRLTIRIAPAEVSTATVACVPYPLRSRAEEKRPSVARSRSSFLGLTGSLGFSSRRSSTASEVPS